VEETGQGWREYHERIEYPFNFELMNTKPINARSRSVITLAEFKARLLARVLDDAPDETVAKLCRLAAGEAEALAWQTPFPLLFLPVLLEEKLEVIQRYAARQARLIPSAETAGVI
jgi:hypothetical protein